MRAAIPVAVSRPVSVEALSPLRSATIAHCSMISLRIKRIVSLVGVSSVIGTVRGCGLRTISQNSVACGASAGAVLHHLPRVLPGDLEHCHAAISSTFNVIKERENFFRWR
jgi:hypothetical protein